MFLYGVAYKSYTAHTKRLLPESKNICKCTTGQKARNKCTAISLKFKVNINKVRAR
jgi:hypothetical protein